jgi:hypothetical protein
MGVGTVAEHAAARGDDQAVAIEAPDPGGDRHGRAAGPLKAEGPPRLAAGLADRAQPGSASQAGFRPVLGPRYYRS